MTFVRPFVEAQVQAWIRKGMKKVRRILHCTVGSLDPVVAFAWVLLDLEERRTVVVLPSLAWVLQVRLQIDQEVALFAGSLVAEVLAYRTAAVHRIDEVL